MIYIYDWCILLIYTWFLLDGNFDLVFIFLFLFIFYPAFCVSYFYYCSSCSSPNPGQELWSRLLLYLISFLLLFLFLWFDSLNLFFAFIIWIDSFIQLFDSIIWFDSLIRFYDSMLDSIIWFDSLVRLFDSILWFDCWLCHLVRLVDSIIWFNYLIRILDSIIWFDYLIRFFDSILWFGVPSVVYPGPRTCALTFFHQRQQTTGTRLLLSFLRQHVRAHPAPVLPS